MITIRLVSTLLLILLWNDSNAINRLIQLEGSDKASIFDKRRLETSDSSTPFTGTIADGIYIIRSVRSNMIISCNTPENTADASNKKIFQDVESKNTYIRVSRFKTENDINYYTLTCVSENLFEPISNTKFSLIQYNEERWANYEIVDNQLWQIQEFLNNGEDNKNGDEGKTIYKIIHKTTGLVMDVLYSGTRVGDYIGLYNDYGYNNQLWKFIPTKIKRNNFNRFYTKEQCAMSCYTEQKGRKYFIDAYRHCMNVCDTDTSNDCTDDPNRGYTSIVKDTKCF
eukprot:351385_1